MATARNISLAALAAALLSVSPSPAAATAPDWPGIARRAAGAHLIEIEYVSHTGAIRGASVLLPRAYDGSPLPLVISPHGRALNGGSNSELWGELPAIGGFAVVSPDGQGNELPTMSWGAPGQIDDLARMPQIVREALPWLRIDERRIYAMGGSMGGQESLLLLGRHPRLLAGVAVFDAVSDFARQYGNFPRLRCGASCRRGWGGHVGRVLQALAQRELGGTPETAPQAYAERSATSYVDAIAKSGVPLQVWWSRTDRIVLESSIQSGRLVRAVVAAHPDARVDAFVGDWIHTAAFRASTRLPIALARFGLLPRSFDRIPAELEHRAY